MVHIGKLAFLDNEIRSLSRARRRVYTGKRRIVQQRLTNLITDGVRAEV
jgi:hypothetical protein